MKALLTLLLVLPLAACAAGQGTAGRTIAEEETTAHSAQEETTALQGQGDALSTWLECKKGATPTEVSIMAVSRGGSGAPESKKFGPVEQVRKWYSGRLKEGDVLQEGYNDTPPERRFVQVVRKGKVVAMFWYDKSGNYIGHDYCKGQF
jgi:hypothetical protein